MNVYDINFASLKYEAQIAILDGNNIFGGNNFKGYLEGVVSTYSNGILELYNSRGDFMKTVKIPRSHKLFLKQYTPHGVHILVYSYFKVFYTQGAVETFTFLMDNGMSDYKILYSSKAEYREQYPEVMMKEITANYNKFTNRPY